MKKNNAGVRHPLSKSVTIVCAVFFLLLSGMLSLATFRIYSGTMYGRYQKQMASIISYVEAHIDHDDMAECAKTYVESEKYKEFQAFFDDLIDHYEDVHYLYIMQVLDASHSCRIREICAANSSYEKEFEPDLVLHLGDGEASWYTPEFEQRFYDILQGDEDVFLLNDSEWGVDYTLARPLVNSAGEHYGLLCADVSIDELNRVINRNVYISIALIILFGILFSALLLLWLRRNVTQPLKRLEKSVADFARKSTGARNPDELLFVPPDIHTHSEVGTLSDAVTKLSQDMRDYVTGILTAETENRGLQAHVTEMSAIAYQDALTKVKNIAAYDEKKEELNRDIEAGRAEFAFVMVDMNDLKRINDRYGHEHGNAYIVGACAMICQVFKHSPVYRVGGDEFVAVLQDRDYRERAALVRELTQMFADSAAAQYEVPWKRYSAAIGLAEYRQGDSVDAVFSRADQEMYRAKAQMKANPQH